MGDHWCDAWGGKCNDLMLDGALLPDGSYTLDVFATDDTGIQSDIISSEFLLQIANSPHLQDDVYHYEFLDTQTVDDLAGSDELIVQRSDNAEIFSSRNYITMWMESLRLKAHEMERTTVYRRWHRIFYLASR